MARTDGHLDVRLQGLVLDIGKALCLSAAGAFRRVAPRSPGQASIESLNEGVRRVLVAVRSSPARKFFGVRQNYEDKNDVARVKAVSVIGWQMVGETVSNTHVEEVAKAIADPRGEPAESYLLARDLLGRMVSERLLMMDYSEGQRWSGRLTVTPSCYVWLCGGSQSRGSFDPRKMDISGLRGGGESDGDGAAVVRVPTARQLYEQVRQRVVGLDPQLRVLASRMVLHAARAEMLAKGGEDTGVGPQVILAVGPSGSGKTFAIEQMAAKCGGLPFASFDASTITGDGWAGGKVEDAIKELVASVGGDVARASRGGVIFMDEACKVLRGGMGEHRLSAQASFLRPLGGSTVVIGGKRSVDCRPYAFPCAAILWVLAGTFDGLDGILDRMAGCRGIGFHSGEGQTQHAQVREALGSWGVIDEIRNRISCLIRFPCPQADAIAKALVGEDGIMDGYNRVLAERRVVLFPGPDAVRLLADYGISTRTYFRGVKHLVGTIVEDVLFDGETGTVVLDAALVRRAIERADGSVVTGRPADDASASSDDDRSDGTPEDEEAVG